MSDSIFTILNRLSCFLIFYFTFTDMHQPEVAIVILNWNGRNYLQEFLPSVLASTYANKRVIVADNASSDDSVFFLQEQYPQVELLIHQVNEGYAGGYNWALEQIASDYCILLNSDVAVEPGWIEPMIQLMERDKKIGACQPKLLAFHQKDHFEYAGACGGWMDALGYPFSRGRIFDWIEKDEGQYEQAVPCFWASGAALCVRTSVYKELNGFYDYFFAHQEEIDLCWRMQRAGHQVFVQPASVVYHVGGGTLPKGNSRKAYLNFRNNLIMLWRNWSALRICLLFPVRLILDGVMAFRGLLTGDRYVFMAVLKAHFAFYKWLIWVKDHHNIKNSYLEKMDGYFHGSVVWDFFIRKKKKFSEIVGAK